MSRLAAAIERELPLLRLQEHNLGDVLATKGLPSGGPGRRSYGGETPSGRTPPCFKEFIDLTECITLQGSKCCTIEYTHFLECWSKYGFFEPKFVVEGSSSVTRCDAGV